MQPPIETSNRRAAVTRRSRFAIPAAFIVVGAGAVLPTAAAAKPGYIGVWASTAKACQADPHQTEDIAIRYSARVIDGNEWSCTIGQLRAVAQGWRARLSCSIEGSPYVRRVLWHLNADGTLQETEGNASQTYVRCKDSDYRVAR